MTQGESLLSVLLENLSQRMAVTVTEFGTQTAMDCVDHRIVLGEPANPSPYQCNLQYIHVSVLWC